MKYLNVLLGFLAVSLSGCANFNTVDRSTELPVGGKAVHLDAPQRVAIADSLGHVCAEPSPDALQAYASSLGAGLQPQNAVAISIAQALSTNAGSIGLRTQSITLMRDALYRICEQYKNGSLSRGSVHVLLERYQDLTLGILAIEQLTGAVAAPQVTLNMNSVATSAAEINSIQRELDKAKEDENAKKKVVESTSAALDKQKNLVAEKTQAALTAKKNAKNTQEQIDKLEPILQQKQNALDKSEQNHISLISKQTELNLRINGKEGHDGLIQEEVEKNGVWIQAQSELKRAEDDYGDALNEHPSNDERIHILWEKLQDAINNEKDAKSAWKKADSELKIAKNEQKEVNQKISGVELEANNNKSERDIVVAQVAKLREDPKQAAADKAEGERVAAVNDEKDKQKAKDEADKALKLAQDNTRKIEELGDQAKTSASASASGTGSTTSISDRYGVNKDTVAVLSQATKEIVDAIVKKGNLATSCMAIFLNGSSDQGSKTDEGILNMCKEILRAQTDVYKDIMTSKYTSTGGTGPSLNTLNSGAVTDKSSNIYPGILLTK